eukprot:tig00001368_g8402.t1
MSQQRKPGEPIKVSSKPRAPVATAKPAAARRVSAPTAPAGAGPTRAPASAPARPAAAAGPSHAAPVGGAGGPLEGRDYSLPPSREEAEAQLRATVAAELARAEERERGPAGEGGAWRDVRVFISSTFKDMHGERDCLNKIVFPRLNGEYGRARRTRFTCVDLRWGLTQEDTAASGRGAVLCCLDEIRRCRPWFVCLLGARYGWVPERTYLPPAMTDDDLERYAWLRRWPLGESVTELEVWYGLLGAGEAGEGPAPRAFAFLRDPGFAAAIEDEAGRAVFAADNPARQDALRARVAAHPRCKASPPRPAPPRPQPSRPRSRAGAADGGIRMPADPEARPRSSIRSRPAPRLTAALQRSLGQGVRGAFPERAAQRLLCERLAGRCVGREALVDAIADFACGRAPQAGLLRPYAAPAKDAKKGRGGPESLPPSNVLLVTGRPGGGKTSVMARAALKAAAERPAVLHFVAGTEFSAEWGAVKGRLLEEVLDALPPEQAAAAAPKQSWSAPPLGKLAEAVPGGLVLFLDAVNQVEGPGLGGMRALASALGAFRGEARLVLSCIEGALADELAAAFSAPRLPVPGLDLALAGEIVKRSLAEGGKKLTDAQAAALLAKKEATVPLYLRIAVDELLVFGLFEGVDGKIAGMPGEAPALLASVLERLEGDSPLAAPALALVAAAPAGISEDDLLLALAVAEPALGPDPRGEPRPVPRLRWSLLAHGISHLLRPASGAAGLLSFSHRQVQAAVRRRYLAGCPHEACAVTAAGDACPQSRPDPEGNVAKNPRKWEEDWAKRDGRLHQALAVTALLSRTYRPHARHHLVMSAPWHKPTAKAPELNAGVARLASLRALRFPVRASTASAQSAEGVLRGVCVALAGAPGLRKVSFGTGDERREGGEADPAMSAKELPREAALSVALLLRRAPNLVVLDLAGMEITADRLAPLVEAARARPVLRGLSLADNRLYSDAAKPLGELLAGVPSLRRLDVSGNKLTGKGMEAVAKALAAAPGLEALYVDLDNVESSGVAEAAQLLRPLARFAQAAAAAAPALRLYVMGRASLFGAGRVERGWEGFYFEQPGTSVGAAHLLVSGGALTPLLASTTTLQAGSFDSQVLWVEERAVGPGGVRPFFGRLVEHVDPARVLEPSLGSEEERLVGIWGEEDGAGVELRVQGAAGRPEWGRRYLGSLRDPASGLFVLKTGTLETPNPAALLFSSARLVGPPTPAFAQRPGPGFELAEAEAQGVRVELLPGGEEVEVAWGPRGAPEEALIRRRLPRHLPAL